MSLYDTQLRERNVVGVHSFVKERKKNYKKIFEECKWFEILYNDAGMPYPTS